MSSFKEEVRTNQDSDFLYIEFSFTSEDLAHIKKARKLIAKNPGIFTITYWHNGLCRVYNDEREMRHDGDFIKISEFSVTVLTYEKHTDIEHFYSLDMNKYVQWLTTI